MSARFVAGLDGGGSKTALCCLDAQGRLLSDAVFGQMNINSTDRGAVKSTLADIARHLQGLTAQGGACAGLTIASAGASNPEAQAFIAGGLRDAGCLAPFDLVGDHVAALRGAVGKVGAVLIAGTGSICYGRNEAGASARAGGWGYLLDDEGGGYALGRDILRAALRAMDGRGPGTALSALLEAERGLVSGQDIVRFAYDPVLGKAHIAGLAELLPPALDQLDHAALAVCDTAVAELYALCKAVITGLRLENATLALMGSILQHVEPIRAGVEKSLAEGFPALSVITPRRDAAWGAAELARERYLA